MATQMMIKSRHNGNVIDIEGNSTSKGAALDSFPPKTGQSLAGPSQFAANQTWEILADPAGSSHFIIQNPGTGHCIDIAGNSTNKGAAVHVFTPKQDNNQNQLWDFLPDPYDSSYFFIQNPQTGYVIEIESGSSEQGAALVVNPRRLFGNNFQLWSGVDQSWSPASVPALQLSPPPASFGSNNQYVLLPADQTQYLTKVSVALDIIENLVCSSFTVQINGNAPYPPPKGATYGVNWDAQWMQFWLQMQNNSLYLGCQVWQALNIPDIPGNPLESQPELTPSSFGPAFENNTIPAGTRIVLTLVIDQSNDYLTGVSGQVYNNSGPIGQAGEISFINQPTFGPNKIKPAGPVTEHDLAPLGALQVVFVGLPAGNAVVTAGLGTFTINCEPRVSAQLNSPNPTGVGTGETSNCYYGQVQSNSLHQIAQPFGVPSGKITGVEGYFTFVGSGLLPNSALTATSNFFNTNTSMASSGTTQTPDPTAKSDGSFSLIIAFPDTAAEYGAGIIEITVTDSGGNQATGEVQMHFGTATLL